MSDIDKKNNKEGHGSKIAWDGFSSTGKIGMYLLYRALKEDNGFDYSEGDSNKE
jgi:hypothetical protein